MARPMLALGAALGVSPVVALGAQRAPSAAPSRPAVLLEIRPHVGDTLRMRLDQQVEMRGTARMRGADSTRAVTTTLRLLARAIPQRSTPTGTIVLAITDSVEMATSDEHAEALLGEARRSLLDRRVRMRVASDGQAEILDDPGHHLGAELRQLVALMPATLPRRPIAVGESWSQVMTMPGALDSRGAGEVVASFRLDSLSRDGRLAWLSMRGTVSRDATPTPDGGTLTMTGTVTGAMQIDRRRGWMTDARTLVAVRSVLTPSGDGAAEPMRFFVTITQRMRAMDNKTPRD